MIIKKMNASFGNLANSELKLTGGLNIVEAPNESGKSTWCAFIRSMLYGINTSARAKRDSIPDKKRYLPWNGMPMEGSMEVIADGRSITITRTGTAASPMKNFSAVYTDTGEALPTAASDIGEMLVGASEAVFERTAFIKQSGMRIDQAHDLEKRIASLVSSGDEQTSFTEADDKLRAWKNSLSRARTGSIPKLEAKRSEAAEKLSMLESTFESLSDIRHEVKRLEDQKAQLEKDLETHKIIEARSNAQRVISARKRAEAAKEELSEASAEALKYAHASRERFAEITSRAAEVSALRTVLARAKEDEARAEERKKDAAAKKKEHILSDMSSDEAASLSEKALELQSEAEYPPLKNVPGAVYLICTAAAFAAFINAFFRQTTAAWGILGAVCVLSIIAVIVFRCRHDTSAQEELTALLEKYGAADIAALVSSVSLYSSLCHDLENAESAFSEVQKNMEHILSDTKLAENALVHSAKAAFPDLVDLKDLPGLKRSAEEARIRADKAEAEYKTAVSLLDAVEESCGPVPDDIDTSYIAPPMRSFEDTEAALLRTTAKLSDAKSMLDRQTGELTAFGAPELISGEIAALDDEIAELERRSAAISLAAEVLAEANTDMRTRFSPILNSEAGDILSRLTDGRYEKLMFDKSFTAETKSPDEAVSRSALSLSCGTVDQLYLSLRLAMCRMLLSDGEPCPIILDDALANFDDARCREALDLLAEMAAKRQIILFTCHSREASMVKGTAGINIVRAGT